MLKLFLWKNLKQIQESSNNNFQTGIRRIYYITEEYLSDIKRLRKNYKHENRFLKGKEYESQDSG